MILPILPVKMPADLRKATNGKLPKSLLIALPQGGHLHHVAAGAWARLVEEAAQDNIKLSHVGAYRTYEQQVHLFQQRYSAAPTGSKTTRRWNGKTYYLKLGMAPSATPGTSNHGWGLAIDIAHIGDGGRLDWLRDNATHYGWSWEMQSEPWHLRYVLGDDEKTRAGGAQQSERAEQSGTPRTLRRGDTGEDVARLQWALVDAAYIIEGAGNGVFGPRTEAAVRQLQADAGLKVDGIVGAQTRRALGL